jgi:hypothetical protein
LCEVHIGAKVLLNGADVPFESVRRELASTDDAAAQIVDERL